MLVRRGERSGLFTFVAVHSKVRGPAPRGGPSGGGRGGSGDPSPSTALGVEYAIRASCERVFSSGSLRGRRIGVIGLGHVGSRVAKRCARAGATLLLADVDDRKRRLAEQLGGRWT